MNIRKAIQSDIDAACGIYMEAKIAMWDSGINQWQDDYPNDASFLEDLGDGISVICEEDGEVLATAAAYIGHEPTYDNIFHGKWLTESEIYGIIHRIAVIPSSKKRGVASAVISYTAKLCAESGICSMRCDTHRDNKAMQNTLLKNGYSYCGIIHLTNGDERFAYEKVL